VKALWNAGTQALTFRDFKIASVGLFVFYRGEITIMKKQRITINPSRTRPVLLRFREDEFDALKRVAEAERTFFTRWAREAVLRALGRATQKAAS